MSSKKQKEALAFVGRELTGDHPWIPGACFIADPTLQGRLLAVVQGWRRELEQEEEDNENL